MSTTYKTISGDTFEIISRKVYGSESGTALIIQSNPGVFEPISTGTDVLIPDNPSTPENLKQGTNSEDIDEVGILVDGERFRYWESIQINRPIDSMDTISFSAPFSTEFTQTLKPFSYKRIEVTVGDEYIFTGTLIGVNPSVTPTRQSLVASAYSKPGVLNDCNAPASSFPLEYNNQKLKTITDTLIAPFGLTSQFDAEEGAVFDRVSCEPNKKILAFLTDLATQRGLIISSTDGGELLFRKSVSGGEPVAQLEEGVSPLISITPTFSPQAYYSHITGIEPVTVGLGGSQFTVKNSMLSGVIRPLNFSTPDTLSADAKTAVNAKIGRMFGDMVSYSIVVDTWRDSKKVLWKNNSIIRVSADSALIQGWHNFIIKNVSFSQTASTKTAVLTVVLPGAYSGEIPETLPWGL